MDRNPISPDFCAHCHQPLEIITVRFRFAGADVISACPNCAMTGAESPATDRESDGSARMRDSLSLPERDGRSSVGKDGTFLLGHFTVRAQERAWFQQLRL
jgi:hypothetical protein